MTDQELAAEVAAGNLLLEVRDLAFEIADELCAFDIETWHYKAVLAEQDWSDLNMLHNADKRPVVQRALRYLELRGRLVYHPAFPNLVRVEAPRQSNEESPRC